jgi:DNA topoisomerase-1
LLPVLVVVGPYGPFVQLGETGDERSKPKRSSIPHSFDHAALDLDTGIQLLELPRKLGPHPETGNDVVVGVGRFGPYVLHNKEYGNFDRNTHTFTTSHGRIVDVLTVDMSAALEMLAKGKLGRRTRPR